MKLKSLMLAVGLSVTLAASHSFAESGEISSVSATPELSTISGTVTYSGPIPRHIERDSAGQRRNLIRVDPESKGLRNAMVYLIPNKNYVENDGDSLPEIQITQEFFEFLPGVVGVRADQPILFGNDDPENHNVRAKSTVKQNEFNVMTRQRSFHETKFSVQPEGHPIELSCDIHRWMQGWVYVFDHPYFTITNSHGEFSLEAVPNGDYTIVIEQPDTQLVSRSTLSVRDGVRISVTCAFEQSHLYGKATPPLQLSSGEGSATSDLHRFPPSSYFIVKKGILVPPTTRNYLKEIPHDRDRRAPQRI